MAKKSLIKTEADGTQVLRMPTVADVDISTLTSEEVCTLQQKLSERRMALNQKQIEEDDANRKKRGVDFLATKVGKKMKADFVKLKAEYKALDGKKEFKYDLSLKVTVDLDTFEDILNDNYRNENLDDLFTFSVTGKVDKVKGNPTLAPFLNSHLATLLEDACDEALELVPELNKRIDAFVSDHSKFVRENKLAVDTNLEGDWSLLDSE